MRRRGRVCALQILYQLDMNKMFAEGRGDKAAPPPSLADVNHAMQMYWESFEEVDPEDRKFAERLVRGVAQEVPALDAALAGVSHHWKVTRMDKVDRNLLRLAAYEILRCADIPRTASINEAIELAKRFSGNDSGAFVNGVLDQLQKVPALDEAADNVVPLSLAAARRKP